MLRNLFNDAAMTWHDFWGHVQFLDVSPLDWSGETWTVCVVWLFVGAFAWTWSI
jgi:hypothetical protein